jgi:hypothetical protein
VDAGFVAAVGGREAVACHVFVTLPWERENNRKEKENLAIKLGLLHKGV